LSNKPGALPGFFFFVVVSYCPANFTVRNSCGPLFSDGILLYVGRRAYEARDTATILLPAIDRAGF
jgi:hypothetical protein